MPHNVFYLIAMLLAGAGFFCFGIYVRGREKAMWFYTWDKDRLTGDTISDVASYNRAVGNMYCFYAVPCLLIGIIEYVNPAMSIIIFAVTCTFGIALMILCYSRIEKKYRRQK